MSSDRSARPASTARTLLFVALGGVTLGITAQLLRQVPGPLMALGGATAPWLTIGFLFGVRAARRSYSLRSASGQGIAMAAVYLVMWLLSYHVTFAIRESVTQAAAWREIAPWLLLTGPVSVVLGVTAAVAHKRGAVREFCLGLPIAWSMPEIAANSKQGFSYGLVVALPTAALAFLPIVAVDRREVRLIRVVVACGLFAIVGLALFPILRNHIHS
jgi:hypothetical protein